VSVRSFVCLTNIPTPYRLFQFRQMHRELEQRGWAFEAWFMARSEPRRSWTFDPSEFDFPHRFLRGFQLRVGTDSFHVNPEVLKCLRETRPEILLVAGGWHLPTVCMASLSSVPRKIFWSESHLASTRRNGAAIALARRFFLRRFDEFAVPGKLAKEYIEANTVSSEIHLLPNLVDPAIFRDRVRELRQAKRQDARSASQRVLLVTSRLSPEKGLLPFLDSLRLLGAERSKLRVMIAGAGPLLKDLRRRIASCDFDIRLAGDLTQSEMVKLYADGDGFCLPSLSDPNPLAVVEALWAGLPLLLSVRVGNHVECLQEDNNGFLFDPVNAKSVAEAVSRWLRLGAEELCRFGENSLRLAQARFVPETVINHFLDNVIGEECSLANAANAAASGILSRRRP
jgi:glycosyltransferase involved in cell wall biosynthesis